MKVEDIHNVFVIGAGTMGSQIALRCAVEGYNVTAYDVSPDALKKSAQKMRLDAEDWVTQKHITEEQAQAALARVRFTSDPQDAADADLVSESVPEDPEVKGKVFAQFTKICPARTIFTTNTSTLVPSMYASATGRPEQFAAVHFYDVWDANVVDIAPHPGTSQETVETLTEFAKRLGQRPLVFKKECPGYICNALYGELNPAALSLIVDGAASPEDVDRAAMIYLGMRAGPCAILDNNGLDFIWGMYQRNAEADPRARAVADFLKRHFVDKGLLGKKSGAGFYQYPNPAYASPEFLGSLSSEKRLALELISKDLIRNVLAKAVMVAAAGYASVEAIDDAAKVFPGFGEGPFAMMDSIGLDVILADLEDRMRSVPEAPAAADWLKREYVDKGWLGKKTGKGFYSWAQTPPKSL